MAFDALLSVRATAVAVLVTASFTSPIVVKSDAFASASAKLTGAKVAAKQEPAEAIVAGGIEFAMPESWGRLGATAAGEVAGAEQAGTIVSGLCPGRSSGASCEDGTQLTFLSYTGEKGHALPKLDTFRRQLDAQMPRQFHGFAKGKAATRSSGGKVRYLDYRFSWRDGATVHQQRLAAYRHADGSGVVVMADGAELEHHDKAINAFFASAHDAGH